MCGIIGYVGHRQCLPILMEGLKRLEYRGYDSAGVAIQNGKGLDVSKAAGKIRVLASWGDKRLVSLPDVPTLTESGYEAVYFQWSGLFAPAGTPEPVLARLREAARAATVDARFMAALATVETPIQYMDAPELQRFWDADVKKLGDVVRRVGKLE